MNLYVDRLGLTLLHFLWQGSIVALIYAAVRKFARKLSPNGRYLLACAALMAMAITPILTWTQLSAPSPESIAATFTTPMSAPQANSTRFISVSLTSNAAHTRTWPFLAWVDAIWFTGVTAFSLRLFGSCMLAERLRHRMVRPASAEWQRTLDRFKTRVDISRPVRLLVSGALRAPAAIGWLRPIVLVPAGVLTGLPAEQIEALMVHELAHIRRHDYLLHILQSALEAAFFYHPAVWWISGHMRAERELCCDDIAVSITGDAVIYARALSQFDSASWLWPAVIAANGGSLVSRIARLLGKPSTTRKPSNWAGTASASILLAIGAWAVFAQTTARPQFEVASIKPSSSGSIMNVRPLPGRLTADSSVQILVQYAYGVQPFQVAGASGWMQAEPYRIEATAPANTSRDQMFLMLQSLLENRFQLNTHRETRDLPVYTLVAAKSGLRLPIPKEGGCVDSAAEASTEWAGGRMAAPGEVQSGKAQCGSAEVILGPTGARMQGSKVAMPELIRRLSMLLDRSVVDKTGFTGQFSLQLDFAPDDTTPSMPPPPPNSGISGQSLPQALREQLGLQLESARGPVEVIVIDHAERPSAN